MRLEGKNGSVFLVEQEMNFFLQSINRRMEVLFLEADRVPLPLETRIHPFSAFPIPGWSRWMPLAINSGTGHSALQQTVRREYRLSGKPRIAATFSGHIPAEDRG